MKMLQFAFVAALALLSVSNFSIELSGFPFSSLYDARLGNFQELCKWFCGDQYYHDYLFRTSDDVQPRIFCGLCKKKISTTTSTTTTSTTKPSTSSGSSPQQSTTHQTVGPAPPAPPPNNSSNANMTGTEVQNQLPPSPEEMQMPENGTSMEMRSPLIF